MCHNMVNYYILFRSSVLQFLQGVPKFNNSFFDGNKYVQKNELMFRLHYYILKVHIKFL